LKRNRLVDDSGGVEKYKQIEQLSWSRERKARVYCVKCIWLQFAMDFHLDVLLNLSNVTVETCSMHEGMSVCK